MTCTSIVGACVAVVSVSTLPALAAAPMQTSGIYMNAGDYAERRLSLEGDCQSASHKLELHDVWHKPYLEITDDGEKRRYDKSVVYGVRTCSGREYRFVGNGEYQIHEPGPIAVYTFLVPAGRHGRRRRYFFSVGPSGTVLPLTRDDLKRAFPDNPTFQNALDRTFKSDGQLTRFDILHKTFVVNRLLKASTERECSPGTYTLEPC